MKPKRLLTAALLLFVAASVAVLIAKEFQGAGPAALDDGIIAYYFHGMKRCPWCRKIEASAHEAIRQGFAEEMADGRLNWRVVNFEGPGNAHFVDDYDIAASTVVLVEVRDGKQTRWKNLEEVWDHLDNKDALMRFVREEVASFLRGG